MRGLTWLCLGHPRLVKLSTGLLGLLAGASGRLGVEAISRAAYSGIFNLRYYQGAADELGGRAAFWQARADAAPPPSEAPAR